MQNPHAKLHKELGYREVTTSGLQVMDETAITLCKENDIPVSPTPTATLLQVAAKTDDAHGFRPMKFQSVRSAEVLRNLSGEVRESNIFHVFQPGLMTLRRCTVLWVTPNAILPTSHT